MVTPGARCLLADLAAASASAEVRRDALAGDFDPLTGDPAALIGRAPPWIAAAAAVWAYVVDPVPPVPPSTQPAPPPRMIKAPPTSRQLDILAAVRRAGDGGYRLTDLGLRQLARAAGIHTAQVGDVIAGLKARALVEAMPDVPPLLVLGPRAHLYPETTPVRTQRSKDIEALLRAGKGVDEIIAGGEVAPAPSRAEVYRVRAQHCNGMARAPGKLPPGAAHRAVVARIIGGETNQSLIARQVGVSRVRVGQIIENAKERGEIDAEFVGKMGRPRGGGS